MDKSSLKILKQRNAALRSRQEGVLDSIDEVFSELGSQLDIMRKAHCRAVAERALAGDEALKQAPYYSPRRRLDETAAARKPKLAYEG